MPKFADKYLVVDPWRIVEEGFHPGRSLVSESIFSLANEHMGMRGNFDEGYGGETLIGNYLNGVFERTPIGHPVVYPGIAQVLKFMVNSANRMATHVRCEDEVLDLNRSRVRDFRRVLDMRSGVLTRSFRWELSGGREIQLVFTRWLSMATPELACQRISVTSNFDGVLSLGLGIDHGVRHMNTGGESYWNVVGCEAAGDTCLALGRTRQTNQYALSGIRVSGLEGTWREDGKACVLDGTVAMESGKTITVTRHTTAIVIKESTRPVAELWTCHASAARAVLSLDYDASLAATRAYWDDVWCLQDIGIEGDEEQQQGIRYCIFQLHQTYHGVNPAHNIGAKGLSGENYHGATFWDTETYCLPFYIFNNPHAARNLLEYRYRTLPQALDWARQQDAEGAFYPFATIDGTEGCGVWWHGNLEIHVSAAVAYGVWQYDRVCGDKEFLYGKGVEMLVQIGRFFASRGNWGPDGSYGYYGVMGPDEFHTFVNNNCYTNVMGAKCLEWAQAALDAMQTECPEDHAALVKRLGITTDELADWRKKREAMRIPHDPESGIYEQHDGYFALPHMDIHTIPVEDFPLYSHWSLPRIYRYDMTKQPDVLLLMLFFSSEYSLETKRVNYAYYEPRCIHESSLSPSVHAILAAELGLHKEATTFSHFATRLDLDNYNRNSGEGLHTTSIAAAWMNMVYGFGGLRLDGARLVFSPMCPAGWAGFSFRIRYRGSLLEVRSRPREACFRIVEGNPVEIDVYGETRVVGAETVVVPSPAHEAEPATV